MIKTFTLSGLYGFADSDVGVNQDLNMTDCTLQTVLTTNISRINKQLEMWPMPNVMVALPNIGGALCSTPQSLADPHY